MEQDSRREYVLDVGAQSNQSIYAKITRVFKKSSLYIIIL